MDYKLIGSPCGEHGPYTFYKALKYIKNGKTNILALSEFFFVKLWTDSDLISIGELQLLWEDKNSDQTLASLRLYILPENTPDGRTDIHGQDEVLAINEKVVIRVEDLLTWITQATDWHWGLGAVWARDRSLPSTLVPPHTFTIDMEDVNKEKDSLEAIHWETQTGVVVLSYPRYCRFRGVMKRLEGVEEKWLSSEVRMELVVALGGFTVPWKNTRVLFCKDTFDYPDLEGHELLCNHLAPKLKGRPRKRKRTNTSRTESDSESESSQSTGSSSTSRPPPKTYKSKPGPKVGVVKPRLRCTLEVATTPRRPARGPSTEEKNFMTTLHTFMRDRKTPIGRIPVVGFKEVNLFKLYRKVTDLGGYEVVTAGKLWKYVYQVMGGDMSSTSAATLSRRHYEKLLLPYERHIFGVRQNSPQPKLKASLALPPAPAASATTQKTTGGLRNIRLKQEKTSPVSSGKENIPERREMTTLEPVKKEPAEAPDRPSEDTSIRMSGARAMSPALKKQKLEILKEGGLEVTPVGRVSVIQEPAPAPVPPPSSSSSSSSSRPSRVSITVTPDIPHLICPPHPGKTDDEVERKKELQRDRMRQYRWRKCQQELEQSRIHQMKNHEMLLERQGPYQLTSSDKGEQIEQTSKRRRSGPSKIPSKRPVYGNPKDAVALIPYRAPPAATAPGEVLDLRTKPRLNVGHNLEITLVPRNPPPVPVQSVYRYTKPPPLPIQPPQVYLSALYNNMFPRHRPPPAFHLPTAAASPFNAALLYKELLRRQGYFPSLDGATSITLVGQTPTSK